MGSETSGVTFVDFVLAPGEYITEVHGRAGDLVDLLGFKTSMGRTQTFGTSHGGHHFSLSYAGKVVRGFRVGFGGSMHFIGVHFGDIPKVAPIGSTWPSPAPAPVYSASPSTYVSASPGFGTGIPTYTASPGFAPSPMVAPSPYPSYSPAPAPSPYPSPYSGPAPY